MKRRINTRCSLSGKSSLQQVHTMNKIPQIAVIVAGIDEEYQQAVLDGIFYRAKEKNINILCFAAFGGVLANSRYDCGEYNIYDLINYKKLDGVILLDNTISDQSVRSKVIQKVIDSGLPAVAFDSSDHPEFYNISIDNEKAMKEIVRHVITAHGARTLNYVSGPLTNPEAAARYEAFLEVIYEYGLEIDDRRIFFGEFRASDGRAAAEAFLSSGLPLPDAVICANDAMALSLCEELNKNGISVPENVIITGFDNTYNARHNSPALTTVERPLTQSGAKACDIVLDLINGVPHGKTTYLTASPVFSESCGCPAHEPDDIAVFKKKAYKMINRCRNDISLLNRMTMELAETETAASNIRAIEKYVREIRCEKFSICLCSNWDTIYKSEQEDTDEIKSGRYTDMMTAPLILENGESHSVQAFRSTEMLPEPLETGGNVCCFFPLHFREHCLGYYTIANSLFPIASMLWHSIILNISNSFENIRKLINLNSMISELDKLYVNDTLCNIYNRNGFIRAADSIFKECKTAGKMLLISFIDMDGLKLINDNYGHKEGDFALQRLAAIISNCCGNRRICARFGGDEFIILGSDANEGDISELESSFNKYLENTNRVINKPYTIAASIGTIVTSIDSDINLFNLITKADSIMYENKKKKKTSRYLRHE